MKPVASSRIEAVQHIRHDNGIDEFIVQIPSKQAVDDWIRQLETIIEATPPDGTIRHLLDLRNGMGSYGYSLQQVRALLARHPDYRKQRLAILHTTSLVQQLTGALIPLLRLDHFLRVRYFKPQERSQAVDWLLADS
jgi:hypothetical protein